MSNNSNELAKMVAEFSKTHNSGTLIPTSSLPQWVLDIPTPEGLVLAANVKPRGVHELEGDASALEALKNYVDLDKEGLSVYKDFLNKN